MPKFRMEYEANDSNDAQKKANALTVLLQKVPTDDLLFIAQKVQKDGAKLIEKLHRFKNFI